MIITDYQGNHYLSKQTPTDVKSKTEAVIDMIKADSSLSQKLVEDKAGVKNLAPFLRLFFFARIDFGVSAVNWDTVASYVSQLENIGT